MTKKEFRKKVKDWLDENQIAFDPSLNTKNLVIFASKQEGFNLDDFKFEEDEPEIENETGTGESDNLQDETGEGTGEENTDIETDESTEEQDEENGEQETDDYDEDLQDPETAITEPVVTPIQSKKRVQRSNSFQKSPSPEDKNPEKKDNSWMWTFAALIIAAMIYMLIRKRSENGNE